MSTRTIRNLFAPGVALTLLLAAGALHAASKKDLLKPTADECLACDSDASLSHEVNGKVVSLHVDPQAFKESIHGSMFTCVDCHTDVKSSAHETPPQHITCATCHADEQAAYERSFHAKAVRGGNANAATCVDGHGSPHALLPASDPKSRVHHSNIPATCGACHSQKFVMEGSGLRVQTVSSYAQSVHGHAVANGSEKAAVCTDCHGTHEILDAKDSKSPIFKFNVPVTCGKCHEQISKEFQQSIHGQAIAKANWQAPVCTDCHGIHSIKAHTDPNSPVSAQNVAQATCARCHEGMRLSQEFGVEGRRETTYLASYHGLASRGGSQVVANCASCHGTHSIFPSSNPRSTIHRSNLARTCGQCHPGVTEKFTASKVHVDAALSADIGSKAVRWIRKTYLALIFMVIGGMLAHNFIIWRAKVIARRKLERRFVTRKPLSLPLAACHFAHEFHPAGAYGLRSEVPGFLVRIHAVSGRTHAALAPSGRSRGCHRCEHRSPLRPLSDSRRTPPGPRSLPHAGRHEGGMAESLVRTIWASPIESRSSLASTTRRRRNTGLWSGACSSWLEPVSCCGRKYRSATTCRAGGSMSRPQSITTRRCSQPSRSLSGIFTKYSLIPTFIR